MHRSIPDGSKIKTSSITKKADGWYLNVTLDDPTMPVLPKEDATWDNSLGIDAVLKDDVYLALSNGETIKSVKPFRVNESSLAKTSKVKELAKKGSRKRRKLARKQAKFHQRIARQRKQHRYDTAHKIVDSGAKNIFVEDLNLQGLSKRNKAKSDEKGHYLPNGQSAKSGLNKSWSDAAFGMFFDTLTSDPGEQVRLGNARVLTAVAEKAHRTRVAERRKGMRSKRASKQKGVQITRDLDTDIVTAMIDVFQTINQAHVHNL